MSPAEKRYFKRHYGSESNTLTHLYDAINLQKEYDEESIKAQFTGKVAINLKVYKFQLEQLLLKSLSSHRHFSTLGSKIRLGIEHFEILTEKNLLKMAEKQLAKTKQLCLNNEQYVYLPAILEKESYLNQIKSNDLHIKELKIHEKAEYYSKKMIAHYEQAARLDALIDLYLKKTTSISQAKLDYFLEKLNIIPRRNGSVPESDQLLQNIFIAIQKYLLGDYKIAFIGLEEVVAYFKQHKKQIENFPHYYLIALRCLIDGAFHLEKFDEAQKYIQEGIQFTKKNEPYYNRIPLFASYQIRLRIKNNQLPSFMEEDAPAFYSFIEELELEHELHTQLFYGWMAIAHLLMEENEAAQSYCQKIQSFEDGENTFVKALGRMLEFVMYFETPDFQKMSSFLTRIKSEKVFKSGDENKGFYKAFLKFADRLATNPRTAKQLATDLLQQLAESNLSPLLQLFRAYKLDLWLQSIVDEASFGSYFNATELQAN